MNIKTHFLVVSICLAHYSCGFLDNGKGGKEMSDIIEKNRDGALKDSHQETSEKIDDYTDTYTIMPKYGDPKFKELITQFNKQEHRFEIDTCEFKYNDQSFFIGDSPEKIISIFGEPDGGIIESIDKTVVSYVYQNLLLTIRFSIDENKMVYYLLRMRDNNGDKNKLYDIIKFRKIPYKMDMELNDFMILSNLTHSMLKRTKSSFYMIQKECSPKDNSRIKTVIGSYPAFESKGTGHLTYRGNFDPNTSDIIKAIDVSLVSLEKIKE